MGMACARARARIHILRILGDEPIQEHNFGCMQREHTAERVAQPQCRGGVFDNRLINICSACVMCVWKWAFTRTPKLPTRPLNILEHQTRSNQTKNTENPKRNGSARCSFEAFFAFFVYKLCVCVCAHFASNLSSLCDTMNRSPHHLQANRMSRSNRCWCRSRVFNPPHSDNS